MVYPMNAYIKTEASEQKAMCARHWSGLWIPNELTVLLTTENMRLS